MNARFSDWQRGMSLAVPLLIACLAKASPQLVSLPDPAFAAPAGAGGDSMTAVISASGRFVAFASTAENLVPSANNGPVSGLSPRPINIFLRDRASGTTTLISVSLAGTGGGDGNSFPAGISTNGQYVLFESTAGNLVAGDTNNANDVFLRDLVGGTTSLVSVNTSGLSGNGASHGSALTPDGRYVAFVSAATNLVAGDTNGIPDVFVRDLQTGATTLISVDAMSARSYTLPSQSESPRITPDGRFVAFYSTATNLVPGVEFPGEVYVRDTIAGTTTLASTNARSLFQTVFGTTNVVSCNHRLSDDGQVVAFAACTNPVTGVFSRGLILRHNLQTGVTDLVHTNVNVPLNVFEDVQTLDMTPDGRFVVYVAHDSTTVTATCVRRWDAQAGTNLLVSANLSGGVTHGSLVQWPGIDPSGRYVVFHSTATNLTTNASAGVFVRDVQTAATRMVNVDSNGRVFDANWAAVPAMSDDGRFVAFESQDPRRGWLSDIRVRDLATNLVELISARHPDLPSFTPCAASGLSSLAISSNGFRVAFTSEADNLVPNDTNGYRDVFVRDLLQGTNLLVSVGTNGRTGFGFSLEPSLSADGRYVAFSSFATNLVAGDINKSQDVFVRDLEAGTTTLVSVSTNGGWGSTNSFSPQISRDGRYVLFRSKAQNLAVGLPGAGIENLFFRDLLTGTTHALTTASLLVGVGSASMTPDGRFVAFVKSPGSQAKLCLWDSQMAATVYTNSGPVPSVVSISPDGRFIAYYEMLSPIDEDLYLVDCESGTNWIVSGGVFPSRLGLRFNSNSRYLVYSTTAANVAGDTNGREDIYLYDVQAGSHQLISRRFDLDIVASGTADSPDISPDGRFVAYRSFASNSVPGDLNEVPDLFLYDRLQGATILVSANSSGFRTANGHSLKPVFSGDGGWLLFQSWAGDLATNDFNQAGDVWSLSLVPAPMTDLDGDGMDDAWETNYFSTSSRDGADDFDADGAADWSEFQAGTDPIDPGSFFRVWITYSGPAGQNPSIAWPVVPGRAYRAQFKNSLGDPAWQDLDGNIILVGNTGYLIDTVPDAGQRFYRVVLLPDGDADGMLDQWESDQFRTVTRDGAGDYDGDGAWDFHEYQAGTDPGDATSSFHARVIYSEATGPYPLVSWSIVPGRNYTPQFKDTLGDADWQNLVGTVTVMSNTASIYDLAPSTGGRFYRIVLNP